MSTATFKSKFATVHTMTVQTGQAATLGRLCAVVSATECKNAGAADDTIIGVFAHDAAAGETVDIYCPAPIVKVVVGTGGATVNNWAIPVANGVTDAPAHDSSGATNDVIVGKFVQSGVVGDRIGMLLVLQNRGSA
jgi:hypothetical protein